MPALKVYSYEKTGAILREDAPLSIRTIERMVHAGDLERIGERQRRGISERSIEAYQKGDRGIWAKDAKTTTAAARLEVAMLQRRRTGRGQGTTQKPRADTTSSADSIPARLPKHGVIRS